MNRDDIHTCSYSCERPACIKAQRDELVQKLPKLVAEAVAAEREACAKICDETRYTGYVPAEDGGARQYYDGAAEDCAEQIRARGET